MIDLPNGWTEVEIGDVAELVRGVSYKKPQARSTPARGYSPILRATNVTGAGLVTDRDLVYVPNSAISPTQQLRVGDVLVATSSGSSSLVGKSAIVRQDWDGAFGAFCAVLRNSPSLIEPLYLAHFVASSEVRRQWSEAAKGTNINNLKRDHILSTTIRLPPLNEQRRIVNAIEEQFSRLEDAVGSLQRATKKLATLEQRVFAAGFEGEWSWTTLGEIADLAGGVTKDSKNQTRPGLIEVPYLRVANVQRAYLDLSEVTTIRVTPEKLTALALRPGDVLFNEGGDRDKLGRGWVWGGAIDPCIHQNHVFRARLHPGFDPRFVSWHGNTFGQQWFWDNGKQTTNLASLSLTTLKRFPVPAPTLGEQQRIVSELERRLSLIGGMRSELVRSHTRDRVLRQAILNRSFAGHLVDDERHDEPVPLAFAGDRNRAVRSRRRVDVN